MKILHIASFCGNIGDNANHAGFRPWFQSLLGYSAKWENFEIRDIYRKERRFDKAFLTYANKFNLIIWGGGNYFELWVDHSPTGTSLSIPEEIFKGIRSSMFFNALGVDDGQGHTTQTISRFRKFLKMLLSSPQYLVSVRNDGSMETLQNYCFDLPIHRVLKIPDGGFFANYKSAACTFPGPHFGINIAGDMLSLRFPGGNQHTFQSFLSELAEWIKKQVEQNSTITFTLFPHIFSDVTGCAQLLQTLPDSIRREKIRVAGYASGNQAAARIFGEYATCDAVLGMRFHANVVPISLGVPTVGLCCYPQIYRVYNELGMSENCINVTKFGFSDQLSAIVDQICRTPSVARKKIAVIRKALSAQRKKQTAVITDWLKGQKLKYR